MAPLDAAAAPLNGPYTVKPGGGGSFLTLSVAQSSLTVNGMSGPVTINVYSGTYSEAFHLTAGSIAGSQTYPLTIQAAPGQAVTVQGTGGEANVVLAQGVFSRLTIASMTLAGEVGDTVYLNGVSSATISGSTITTTDGYNAVTIDLNSFNDNIVRNLIQAPPTSGAGVPPRPRRRRTQPSIPRRRNAAAIAADESHV